MYMLIIVITQGFFIDCEEVQYKGFELQYSWLLILITLSSWREPNDNQFLEVKEKPFLVARYQNLWYTMHKAHQMDSHVAFCIYKETIRDCVERIQNIPPQVLDEYKEVAHLKVGHRHM